MKSLVLLSALSFLITTLVIAEIIHGLGMVWAWVKAL